MDVFVLNSPDDGGRDHNVGKIMLIWDILIIMCDSIKKGAFLYVFTFAPWEHRKH